MPLMNPLFLAVLILLLVFVFIRLVIQRIAPRGQKFWLFYAGPENYLDENGERDFQGETLWSCEPGTRKGDLILLYRKSINQLSVNALIRTFNMTEKVARDIKARGVGKDVAALWQAVSNSRRQFGWGWRYGCYVREIRKLNRSVSLDELKAVPELRRWEALRWNFEAKGRSALEIPPFAWDSLTKIIEGKCGLKIEGHSSDKTDKAEYRISTDEVVLKPFEEERLYEALRTWRNKQARRERLLPYMVAHNSSLKQMVRIRVRTKEDLLRIKGFGERRAEKYGSAILNAIESLNKTR